MTTDQPSTFSRRSALALAGAGAATLPFAASQSATVVLDLSDPAVALDTYARLRGSTATETVYQVYGGNIFVAVPGQVPEPLIGFQGLQKANWRSDGDAGFFSTDYDLGLYVDASSREVLDTWDNPITGKTIKVMHYRSGPTESHHSLAQDSRGVYGAFFDSWQINGDQVMHESNTWGDRKNLLQPEDYPLGSSGERFLSSMSYSLMGRMSELADPALAKTPCTYVWSFIAPWPPWMEMGQRPGFVVWRWIGHKMSSRAEVPPELVADVNKVWPDYTDAQRPWEEPSSGWNQYLWMKQGHKPR